MLGYTGRAFGEALKHAFEGKGDPTFTPGQLGIADRNEVTQPDSGEALIDALVARAAAIGRPFVLRRLIEHG